MTDELNPVRCGCGGEMITETLGNPVFGHRLRCPKWHIMTSWFDSEVEAIEAWNKAMCAKDINVPGKFVTDTNAGSKEPEQSRKFLEIVTEYRGFCTYPEYEGKPYYGIKYAEKRGNVCRFWYL